jgi:hypothetical protein
MKTIHSVSPGLLASKRKLKINGIICVKFLSDRHEYSLLKRKRR